MAELNYHHLRYFRAIAHQRSLTRAAEQLHVSPSALSIQLRQLEERLGQSLFERRHRQLVLTEAGRIALEHADAIFKAGEELVSTLQGRPQAARPVLRVGSAATLSRNFQLEWLRPLVEADDSRLLLVSGSLRELLVQLEAHTLDVVLSNHAVARERGTSWHSQLVAEQPVSLVGRKPKGRSRPFRFPQDLDGQPVVVPSETSAVRTQFDLLLDLAGVRPRIVAEVDDMAMMRLLAREASALTLVPPVVVRDELRTGVLVERCRIPQIHECFYAITASRRFPHPDLRRLLASGRGRAAAPPG
jgi:LysR family transcriptional activator of nhaA